MAENKDNGDGWGGLALLAIVGCIFLFILKLVTLIGGVIGLVSWFILYVVFKNYFYSKERRLYRLGAIWGVGLVCYLILTFIYTPAEYSEFFSWLMASIQREINAYGFWSALTSNLSDYEHIKEFDTFNWIRFILGASISCILIRILQIMFGGKSAIKAVKEGKTLNVFDKKVKDGHFKKLDLRTGAIGVSFKDLTLRYISDQMLNEMLLALGTTGAGKTILFRNLYARNIMFGNACVVVDGKPDPKNIRFLEAFANKYEVPFYSFNCCDNYTYDFLNNGTATELKDKIIGLKNEADWDSDYYKTQAETYLQTALEILKKVKGKITLDDVIDSFEFKTLKALVPADASERTLKKLSRIKDIEVKDLKGIQNQLTLLANSDMGDWLSSGEGEAFTLLEAIEQGAFVYFALPALKYPSFSKVLGRVIVNDLKTVLYDKPEDTPVFSFFDEFGVFAGEQVLNLVNQGRGLGLYSCFGIQSLADLSRLAGQDFLEVFMGNMNTLAVMRVNDNKTTSYLADWVGKYEAQEYQAHVNDKNKDTGLVKMVEKYLIKAEEMQRLNTGEAFLITKVNGFGFDKIKVNYID
ncbi:type IV secretion-system coupling DNA-binding domain protein (plasmid) [Francisella philomiragia]|uniref:type IV secretory system conjugative DNA transfer family protein n=1 Tax=Francisella philomiragia TaxID=28110 RepID=UPI0005A58276|nr:TraM recognition domain-containing protein [Francisella philomiragia]AJI58124.1 type IV secretion-system coupling DNA-binding domain protein [Francisella philomiragia]